MIGITCPACGGAHLEVTDSRSVVEGEIRRRRRCTECGSRVTTYERPEAPDGRTLDSAKRLLGCFNAMRPADRVALVRLAQHFAGDAVVADLEDAVLTS